MIKFDVTKQEAHLCFLIAKRAINCGLSNDQLSTEVDVTAVHANGCPLDLEKLLTFSTFDFAHDIAGIAKNLDRRTGQLKNLFSPRCTARNKEAATT